MMTKQWHVFGGQAKKKECNIYRLLSTGTIEEKIYQRQVTKKALSSSIVSDNGNNTNADSTPNSFSVGELRDLFTFRTETVCDTHDLLNCGCSGNLVRIPLDKRQSLAVDELSNWEHYDNISKIKDPSLASIKPECVTFVFSRKFNPETDTGKEVIERESILGVEREEHADQPEENVDRDIEIRDDDNNDEDSDGDK